MSWLYLPGQAAGFSGEGSSGGERSAMSSGRRTRRKSSSGASETGQLRTPRSGGTSAHLTEDPGLDAWILSLEDSRANPSRLPESGWGRMTRATCGLRHFASYKRSGQNGAFWKMSRASFLSITLGRFSGGWPKAGMIAGGHAYRLPPLEPPTAGRGSGSWPTPIATPGPLRKHDGRKTYGKILEESVHEMKWPTPRSKLGNFGNNKYIGKGFGRNLENIVFPTPRSSDTEKSQWKNAKGRDRSNFSEMLSSFMLLRFPTPTSTDSKISEKKKGKQGYRSPLARNIEENQNKNLTKEMWLNPDWVEWLMGWPIGYTGSDAVSQEMFSMWKSGLEKGAWWKTALGPNGLSWTTKKDEWTSPRLKAIGNGQVPLVVAVVWRLLEMGGQAMGDKFSKNVRSKIMSAIRSEKTGPEKMLWDALKKMKVKRFTKNDRGLPGSPDAAIHGKKIAIFVDGCFWHGCKDHYKKPKSNVEYWNNKFKANRKRDRRVNAELKKMKWKVIRVWEHDLKKIENILKKGMAE